MEIVVVCFGAPSISGDAFGPIVGDILVEKYNIKCYLYGTIKKPITGRNLDEYLPEITQIHRDAVMLAVDASLGKIERVWQFSIRKDGVCPASVCGAKNRFGDVGVLGVVGENNGDNINELLSSNAVEVSKMADKVAFVINNAINQALKTSLIF